MSDIRERAAQAFERRQYDLVDVEVRGDTTSGFTFEGVASVVDKPYEVNDMWGTFTETVSSGAFNKTLRDSKADVALFLNHDYRGIPLATRFSKSSPLTLTTNPNLVAFALLNPLRTDVQNVRHAVNDGILNQMSVGFSVPKGKDEWNTDMTQRTIHEMKLMETSIVWQGANPHTSASMRSFTQMVDELTAGELDESELRRIIDHLSTMLPAPAATPEPTFTLTQEEFDKFWAHKLDS